VDKITIIDNEYITLWCYPEKKIIHHKFHKFIHRQAFRDGLNAGCEAMEKYGAEKWLSDDRLNAALPQADVEWSRTDWFPRVMKAGWKYWALLPPEKIIGQMNMDRIVRDYSEKGLTVKIFTDLDEAMTWLESQ
jgi:hypothetical protein